MQRIALHTSSSLALLVAGMLAVAPALADKPSWAGEDKGGKHEREDRQNGDGEQGRNRDAKSSQDGQARHFEDRHRVAVNEYYTEQFRQGRCPPGLAKKHDGCMPPGQAKRWNIGQPLPKDVTYYTVPPAVVVQLGPPPAGHRYVRVASDILLIAAGTGMVVDAIQNLGRM
jgi:Ni/Co efflux regulator RcnB